MDKTLKEYMGDKYDEYREFASASSMFGINVGSLNKDDLLAVIGFVAKKDIAHEERLNKCFNLLGLLRSEL